MAPIRLTSALLVLGTLAANVSAVRYYEGCFLDRDWGMVPSPGWSGIWSTTSASMTVDFCDTYCPYTPYFALVNGNECRCAQFTGWAYDRVYETQCNKPCAGNSSERCGGDGALVDPRIKNYYAISFYRRSNTTPFNPSPHPDVPAVDGFTYQGCKSVLATGRYFDDGIMKDTVSTTIEGCGKYCLHLGHPAFGLHRGNECHCSSRLVPIQSSRPETACDAPCAGNSSQICGGTSGSSVYLWNEV